MQYIIACCIVVVFMLCSLSWDQAVKETEKEIVIECERVGVYTNKNNETIECKLLYVEKYGTPYSVRPVN